MEGKIATPTTSTTTFHQLVEEFFENDIEYGGYLCNHELQGLTALMRLGASAERLVDFQKHYRSSTPLEPMPKSEDIITASNWKEMKGKDKNFSALTEFFLNEIHASGREAVLRQYLPLLCPGVASSAFHATIQLGYGILSDSDVMIASGLGYLVLRYWSVGTIVSSSPSGEESGFMSPKEVLLAIRSDTRFDESYPKDEGFQVKMRALVASSVHEKLVAEYASKWPISTSLSPKNEGEESNIEAKVQELMRTVVVLFDATHCRGFFSLHTITGLHALRAILPLCDEQTAQQMLQYYWKGVCCSYVVLGRPDLETSDESAKLNDVTWKSIIERAIAHNNDEHVIKVCEALHYSTQHDENKDQHHDRCLAAAVGALEMDGNFNFQL